MYLVCGEALFDFFSEDDASGLASKVNFKAIAGGSPFNVAVGLRRLGVDSALFGGLSTDYLGRRLQQVLQDEGVRPDYLVDFAARPRWRGRRRPMARRISFRGKAALIGTEPGASAYLGTECARLARRLVSWWCSRLRPCWRWCSVERQRLISPPQRAPQSRPNIDLWRERIAPLATGRSDKVSDEDLSLLYPEQDPQRVIEGWLEHRCHMVFLTRGGEGASVFSRAHGSWSVPACSVKIADTVGAGDTFQAALITWLTEQGLDSVEGVQHLAREQIDAMLNFAVQAAALTCSKTGPDLPYRHQLT